MPCSFRYSIGDEIWILFTQKRLQGNWMYLFVKLKYKCHCIYLIWFWKSNNSTILLPFSLAIEINKVYIINCLLKIIETYRIKILQERILFKSKVISLNFTLAPKIPFCCNIYQISIFQTDFFFFFLQVWYRNKEQCGSQNVLLKLWNKNIYLQL